MSLKVQRIGDIPLETIRVAKAAFRKPSAAMMLRDEFGSVYNDEDFATSYPVKGQPALPPWRLALVTVLQFMENLTDRQAADAVRARVDWKYALGLELTDPGFDASVLSEFRTRLVSENAEDLLLDKLLEHFKAKGLLKARGKQRTDSTHVLARVRSLNLIELLAESLRMTLNELADKAPEWLAGIAPEVWYERYGRRIEEYRLPRSKAARHAVTVQVGEDGFLLLDALSKTASPELQNCDSVSVLKELWEIHYQRKDNKVIWCEGK